VRIERLAPRERALLHLAEQGLDDAAIADRLRITPATLKNYWLGIYQLLGLAGAAGRRERAIARWQGVALRHAAVGDDPEIQDKT
jgi:DNA-binding NarL/FixJ family response regulator